MKIIFNDATEITVQQVKTYGDYLNILTVGNTYEIPPEILEKKVSVRVN